MLKAFASASLRSTGGPGAAGQRPVPPHAFVLVRDFRRATLSWFPPGLPGQYDSSAGRLDAGSCRSLPGPGRTLGSLAGDVLLARTATGPLAGDDRPALEDLATPHAPRLLPCQRA